MADYSAIDKNVKDELAERVFRISNVVEGLLFTINDKYIYDDLARIYTELVELKNDLGGYPQS